MDVSHRQQLNEISEVLGLKDHPGWQTIMRDAKANYEEIGAMWFNLDTESVELKQLRAQQIANARLLGLMDLYEAKLEEIGMDALVKEVPELVQNTDVDPGIVEEESDE